MLYKKYYQTSLLKTKNNKCIYRRALGGFDTTLVFFSFGRMSTMEMAYNKLSTMTAAYFTCQFIAMMTVVSFLGVVLLRRWVKTRGGGGMRCASNNCVTFFFFVKSQFPPRFVPELCLVQINSMTVTLKFSFVFLLWYFQRNLTSSSN